MGSGSNRPQEIEIGESGFALLFPQIEGIKIQPFHFIKDPKNSTLERHQLAEVGKLMFTAFTYLVFEAGSHYVVLAGLDLRSSCLCLLNAGGLKEHGNTWHCCLLLFA